MGLDYRLTDKSVVFVFDTSFIVDALNLGSVYTQWLRQQKKTFNSRRVVPKVIKEEYEELGKQQKQIIDGIPIAADFSNFDEWGGEPIEIYDLPLSDENTSWIGSFKINRYSKDAKSIDRLDKLLIQAALEYSNKNQHVVVATADSGIASVVEYIHELDFNISHYSPWSVFKQDNQDLSDYFTKQKILTTSYVVSQLLSIENPENTFIAVTNKFSPSVFALAFDVLQKQKLTDIEGEDYIPVFVYPEEALLETYRSDYTKFFLYKKNPFSLTLVSEMDSCQILPITNWHLEKYDPLLSFKIGKLAQTRKRTPKILAPQLGIKR